MAIRKQNTSATPAEPAAVPADLVQPAAGPDAETVALSDIPGMAMHLADDREGGAAAVPKTAEPEASTELKAIIEALVFASPEPLAPKALFKLLDSEPREDVERALASLKADYRPERGLQIVEIAGGLQIVTRTDLHEWVRRLFHERKTSKLSVQALETLAVVAYRQPVTAAEITEIRAVNTAGVLGTLIERKLVKIAGRKPVVGRPFLYATTREFLMRFGLNDLTDLPKVEDLADALGFEISGLGEAGPSEQFLPLEAPGEDAAGPPPDDPAAQPEPDDDRPVN
ncbi:MAG: SMC-Scp complex subunit ScpB [Vicinamibacterales bacterium]